MNGGRPWSTETPTNTNTNPGTGSVSRLKSDTETPPVTGIKNTERGFVPGSEPREGGEARARAPEGGGLAPSGADLFNWDQLHQISLKNKINLSTDGLTAFLDQMKHSGWTLYGRPVEKSTIVRVLREWRKKSPEYGPIQTPKKPERLEPFSNVQREKFLRTYDKESEEEAEEELWNNIYWTLQKKFPAAEREKIDPYCVDWDDERLFSEAVKGGFIDRYTFAKDVRRFILTETGVRFYEE